MVISKVAQPNAVLMLITRRNGAHSVRVNQRLMLRAPDDSAAPDPSAQQRHKIIRASTLNNSVQPVFPDTGSWHPEEQQPCGPTARSFDTIKQGHTHLDKGAKTEEGKRRF